MWKSDMFCSISYPAHGCCYQGNGETLSKTNGYQLKLNPYNLPKSQWSVVLTCGQVSVFLTFIITWFWHWANTKSTAWRCIKALAPGCFSDCLINNWNRFSHTTFMTAGRECATPFFLLNALLWRLVLTTEY